MLAVFERIDLSIFETLLTAATGEASLQLASSVNQPVGKGASVPDAKISAHFAYWFEVKTARKDMGVIELTERLRSLESPIANGKAVKLGRAWAWTMGQRYASVAKLTRPGITETSELERP